jgi:molybdopterin/thiamine biosynthesis adenylyltransferase
MLTERNRSRADFQTWLQDAGFEPDSEKAIWIGKVQVEWLDADSGHRRTASHKVAILLPVEFPYHAPIVISQDEPSLAPSWHLSPDRYRSLCLWNSQSGWRPDFTAQLLLSRIADWFQHYHTGIWPADSEVPDLHQYLTSVGVVVIGHDWVPPSNQCGGRFILWRHLKFSDTFPCLASCREDDGSQSSVSQPESRLADNLLFIQDKANRISGVWFRASAPFVPPDNLRDLLELLEKSSDSEQGWTQKACISALGQKLASDGFPIAIGYRDHRDEVRWLFLWAQLPPNGKMRHKIYWSNPSYLFQVKLTSFRTAPAKRADLLRRSAHLSTQLGSCKAIIFGVGALGSSVALLLAKAGLGEIRLVDDDVLLPGNVVRHACGLDRVGLKKTMAVDRVIRVHQPDCTVQCYEVTWLSESLKKYMDGCDVVIDTTANHNFSLHLNEVCIEFNRPVIFSTAYHYAHVGRIVIRRGSEDPCLACYAHASEDWGSEDYPIIPLDAQGTFIEDGCGEVTEEAAAIDVEAVANLAARVAIQLMRQQLGENNLALLVNEPLAHTSGVLSQQGLHWWSNKPLAKCAICRG